MRRGTCVFGRVAAAAAASAVVNRSSKVSTGTSTTWRSASRNRSVSPTCAPRSPRSVNGSPTTTRSTCSSRTSSASRASPASDGARWTTQRGRASVPVGSETATPVRAAP